MIIPNGLQDAHWAHDTLGMEFQVEHNGEVYYQSECECDLMSEYIPIRLK